MIFTTIMDIDILKRTHVERDASTITAAAQGVSAGAGIHLMVIVTERKNALLST